MNLKEPNIEFIKRKLKESTEQGKDTVELTQEEASWLLLQAEKKKQYQKVVRSIKDFIYLRYGGNLYLDQIYDYFQNNSIAAFQNKQIKPKRVVDYF